MHVFFYSKGEQKVFSHGFVPTCKNTHLILQLLPVFPTSFCHICPPAGRLPAHSHDRIPSGHPFVRLGMQPDHPCRVSPIQIHKYPSLFAKNTTDNRWGWANTYLKSQQQESAGASTRVVWQQLRKAKHNNSVRRSPSRATPRRAFGKNHPFFFMRSRWRRSIGTPDRARRVSVTAPCYRCAHGWSSRSRRRSASPPDARRGPSPSEAAPDRATCRAARGRLAAAASGT